MVFLSQVVGKPVRDASGERVGTVKDLSARMGGGVYPEVTGVVARQGRRDLVLDASEVIALDERGAALVAGEPLARDLGEDELLLSRHVLDRQVVDVGGRRVVRVNDVQVGRADARWLVTGVDASPQAALQRLGLRRLSGAEGGRELLDWADVEYFASDAPDGATSPSHERLAQLHPADIANIVDAVPYRQGAEIIASLPVETAADAMEEVARERQAELVARMDGERAADIVERMAPDDAADLLGDLDERKARELLDLMEEGASGGVEELLAYPEDSAGGLMTLHYASATPEMSVGETIEHMRQLPWEPELFYYVYVVDSLDYDTPLLLGVASLRDMILGGLDRRMEEVMVTQVHSASPDTPAEDVARVVGEYNLLALPVVEEGQILGIVTVDDVMERLLPEPWRERLPRLFR